MKKSQTALTIILTGLVVSTIGQNRLAPAYPLITHDPYFSIWSMTDTLNQQPTKHWTETEQALIGIIEVDGKSYLFLGKEEKPVLTLLSNGQQVKFTETEPAAGWQTLEFDDKHWVDGREPFSDNAEVAGRLWTSANLWVRKEFHLDSTNFENLFLRINHDDNTEVYLNGQLIYSLQGWLNKFKNIPLDAKAITYLKKGKNVLAIHVANTGGGAWLDAGLFVQNESKSVPKTLLAKQNKVELTATSTRYQFTCGPVILNVSFTSPLLIEDLKMVSQPISFVTFKMQSSDNQPHQVKLTFTASSNLAVNTPDQEVSAQYNRNEKIMYMKTGTVEQPILAKRGDDLRIDWGYLYVATANDETVKQEITCNDSIRVFDMTKQIFGKQLLLNTTFDIALNVSTPVVKQLAIGYDDRYSIQYFYQNLRPWWNKDGKTKFEDLLTDAVVNYRGTMERCNAFDTKIYNETKSAGGQDYARLCILAYRQCLAAHKLVESPDGEMLYLSKENFSNGCINTVDVTYPSAPLFLAYNPDLMKGMLNGIFYQVESGRWQYPFAPHDLGQYPKANGNVYYPPMPVEESGNLLILCAAIAKAENNASYALLHWNALQTWADYLTQEGLDPKNQLCTDDFAGHLARNANLSVKAIMGVKSFAYMSKLAGKADLAVKYDSVAAYMVIKWMQLANAGDHYALTFDDKNTWSQKYNLVWDKVLGFNIFPKEVSQTEMQFYLKNLNRYGLPLDNRKTYTKSDWIIWTATMATSQKDFETLIKPILRFATETPNRIPLCDWYETTNGHSVAFQARSVVGGFYMKLLDAKFNPPGQNSGKTTLMKK